MNPRERKVPKVDLFRKRGSDYSDFAYREAVTKLKYLLAESYTPVTVHKYSPTNPSFKSSYTLANPYEDSPTPEPTYVSPLKFAPLTPPKRPDITFDVAPEYSNYLRKQEDYIQQLEREGRACREELARMLSKVRHVVNENERLKNETKLGSGLETEEESEIEEKEKKVLCKHTCSAPNIVYESRISELEAQLTQTRLELRKAQDEAFFLKTKSFDASSPDSNKQIESLQRERDELNATVNNLQMLVTQLRDKEASATLKVKRSLDVVDQAHFDKNQLEMEIRRLKSDLERMNDKQREIMQESARRVNEAERRYTLQIERLNGDLAAQWDTANRMNLELDRAKRTESELRREVAQKISVIEELKKELSLKTSNLQTEALTAGAERETLESELSTQKLAVERAERAGRQEAARLQAEVASLRQRLDRADSDLLHSRKENLRLSENIGTLEKEMELAKMGKDSKRPDELTNMIKEMDSKHGSDTRKEHPGDGGGGGGNRGGGDGSERGAIGSQEQYQDDQGQYEPGPDKYLGDKTQPTPEAGQYEGEQIIGQESATNEPLNTDTNQYEGKDGTEDPNQQYPTDQGQYEGDPNAYQQEYDPNQYPEGYDPNQYPEGYDPNQYPEGYDPNQYPEGYDPNQYPEGYDPNQYPEGYDPNQYPEGYDPNAYQGEYQEGYTEDPNKYPESAQPTDVQPTGQIPGTDSLGSSMVAQKEEFIPDTVKP